jgi:hypothetical protein
MEAQWGSLARSDAVNLQQQQPWRLAQRAGNLPQPHDGEGEAEGAARRKGRAGECNAEGCEEADRAEGGSAACGSEE